MMNTDPRRKSVLQEADRENFAAASMVDFDEKAYRPHLDGLDISDEQACELMRIVWDIMRMWVEMDLPADSCGQIVENIILPIPDESVSLD